MSPRNSKDAPTADIYVGLLFVSLACLLAGITFMVLKLNEYGWKVSP